MTTPHSEKAIVFGTGSLAAAFCRKLPADLDIVAFADNDRSKQGTQYLGRPVIDPAAIPQQSFDVVIVASCYDAEIRDQLTSQLGVPPDRIRSCPKSLHSPHKSLHPFAHVRTRALGEEVILLIAAIFDARGIEYFIDHGTLLGLVRDGGLMPWDDDIDISVLQDQHDEVLAAIGEIAEKLPSQDEVRWSGHFVRQRRGRLLGVTFVFEAGSGSDLQPVPVAIWFTSFRHGFAEQFINLAPERHFRSHDYVTFRERRLRVPAVVEAYLAYHYGAWRVPRKDIRFAEIDNFRKHEIAVERIPFALQDLVRESGARSDARLPALRQRFIERASRGDVAQVYQQPWIGLDDRVVTGKRLFLISGVMCHGGCDGCRTHTPYLRRDLAPQSLDVRRIRDDLAVLRDLVHVEQLRIVGGEPLLHPHLDEVIEAAAGAGIADAIQLSTSGAAPAAPRVLAACREAGVTLRIMDYGLPEHREAIAALIRTCDAERLNYRRFPLEGRQDAWLEWGGPDVRRDEATGHVHERFRRCARNLTWTLADGRFYKCNRAPYDQWTGLHGAAASDFVDIRSAESLQQKADRIRDYLIETTFLEACRFCTGRAGDGAANLPADARAGGAKVA